MRRIRTVPNSFLVVATVEVCAACRRNGTFFFSGRFLAIFTVSASLATLSVIVSLLPRLGALRRPVFRLFLCLGGVVADPGFICSHEFTRKFCFRLAEAAANRTLEIFIRMRFWSESSNRRADSVRVPNYSVKTRQTRSIDMYFCTVAAVSQTLTLRWSGTIR